MWTCIGDTTPVARKEYRCHLCALPIGVKVKHCKRVGVTDGEIVSCRMHLACEKVTVRWDEGDWETNDEHEFRDNIIWDPKTKDTRQGSTNERNINAD